MCACHAKTGKHGNEAILCAKSKQTICFIKKVEYFILIYEVSFCVPLCVISVLLKVFTSFKSFDATSVSSISSLKYVSIKCQSPGD
jgi:hypothetical protein